MKLEWTERKNDTSVEYVAWGVLHPYKIVIYDKGIIVTRYGDDKPQTVHVPRVTPYAMAFNAAAILAQDWEDKDQAMSDQAEETVTAD